MIHPAEMQNSIDYIEENLKTDLSAAELAQRSGFSTFHYYRLFQAAVGMPVMRYILRRRLLHAIYEMRGGGKRVDIVLAYGFDTYAGFYKAFQREMGCTPSLYLKMGRAKRPYRPNLKKEEFMYLSNKKITEILANWHLENEPVSDLYDESSGEHLENVFSVSENLILKISADPGKARRHAELSHLMAREGLLAALPRKTAAGSEFLDCGGLCCMVTERLKGQPMRAADFYAAPDKALFLGEIIGKMHQALINAQAAVDDVNLMEVVENWALPRAKAILHLSDSFCQSYLARFAAVYPHLPQQIIHRDPNPGNVIAGFDGWGFIDFELSERNVRLYDPCYAATAILSETFEEENEDKLTQWVRIYQNVMRGYDQSARLTPVERKAAPDVLLANQLICVSWFAEQERYPDLFETNKGMTRWLVRHTEMLNLL